MKYNVWVKWDGADDKPESGEQVLFFHKEYGKGIGYYIKISNEIGGTFHGTALIEPADNITHFMRVSDPIKWDLPSHSNN